MMHKDVAFINPRSNIAVCTLWSKKEEVLDKIREKEKVNVIGTLYTVYGLNYLIETLAERPEINTLIICGSDLSDSGDSLLSLFYKGCNKTVFGWDEIKDIIKGVEVVDLRKEYESGNYDAINAAISKHFGAGSRRKKVDLKVRMEKASSYPVPISGLAIYEESPFRAWVKVLKNICAYGFRKPSEYGESQLELLNVMITVGLYGKKYELEEQFFRYFDKKTFEKHLEEVLDFSKPKDVEYTYGERAFRHPSAGNQIEAIIDYLSRSPYTRRALVVLWDHGRDSKSKFPPCLDVYQGIISGDYYNHTVYIRSNDMVDAWPVNIYGQIKLAEYIVKEINERSCTEYKLGTVTTISCSAHIYEHSLEKVKEIVREKVNAFVIDPRGSFLFSHDGENVTIEHRDAEHRILRRMKTAGFDEAYNFLKELYIMPEHAVYLGKELKNVFEKLGRGERYVQDKA